MPTATKTRKSTFRYIDREFVPPTREQKLERIYRGLFPLDATFHTSWLQSGMEHLCNLMQVGADAKSLEAAKTHLRDKLTALEVEAIAHVTGIQL